MPGHRWQEEPRGLGHGGEGKSACQICNFGIKIGCKGWARAMAGGAVIPSPPPLSTVRTAVRGLPHGMGFRGAVFDAASKGRWRGGVSGLVCKGPRQVALAGT
ncbi:hypothetical protein GOODEAATRI_021151 [Goodea atripinnis]|uniref:Uncharacterized protein n=1 Tax=Goodea atripinnis TaxID=208336 RepID=A0ABV0N364_9TELE